MGGRCLRVQRFFCIKKTFKVDGHPAVVFLKSTNCSGWAEGILIYGALSHILFGNLLTTLIFIPSILLHGQRKKERDKKLGHRLLLHDFVDFLDYFNVSVMAGISMENSILSYLSKPCSSEVEAGPSGFRNKMIPLGRRLQVGESMRQILDLLSRDKTLQSEEIRFFAECLSVGISTGGDVKRLVYECARQTKQKIMMEQDLEALIAEKKMEVVLMAIMPYGVLLLMKSAMNEIAEPLFSTGFGLGALFILFLLFEAARTLGERITDIRI